MDMAEIFGWVRTLLTQLGVWDTLSAVMQVMMVVAASMFVFKWLRG